MPCGISRAGSRSSRPVEFSNQRRVCALPRHDSRLQLWCEFPAM